MTAQDLRQRLAEAGFDPPWTADPCGRGAAIEDPRGRLVADAYSPHDAALMVAAVNALPTLLDLAEAAERSHRSHHCDWAGRSAANLEGAPPCAICDALDRLGETP